MNAAVALLVAASLAACGSAEQKPRAPAVIPPIARMHFDDDYGLIFVTALIAGTPRSLMLDSGAPQTILDPDTGGAPDVEMFIGGVPFQPHDVALTPVHRYDHFFGRKIDGIVGYELFERYVVTVDYAAQELAFYDPAHAPTAGDAVPIEIKDHVALVDVVLHDRTQAVAAMLRVATGSRDSVGLTAEYVAAHHLLEGVPTLAREGMQFARLSSIHIGAATIGPLVINFANRALPPPYDGTIGADLLQQFTVTLDYPHQRVLLDARARPPALAFDGSGLVIATFDDDLQRCQVLEVVPASPAALSGIEKGDEIVDINDTPFAELGLPTLWSLLRQQGTLRLTIRHAGADRVVGIALRPLI
jgi:hypothetical protein